MKSLDLSRKSVVILALTALASLGGYILSSALTYRIGFPLDDAWIHQTYARNLAMYGEWSFIRGQISGGSTSPLWSALLAPGFVAGLSPYVWTYFLGFVCLLALAVLLEVVVKRVVPGYTGRIPWAGIFFITEWHLVWASASGMETLLYAFFISLVIGLLIAQNRNYVLMGLLCGLSVWVRPDGVTLLGPILFVAVLSEITWNNRFNAILRVMLGFGILFAFYIFFNLLTTGTPLPNTFYAKQAEYAELLAIPFYERYFNIISMPLVGAGVILLPGVIMISFSALKKKQWGIIAGLLWFLGYAGLYAVRLPVSYQHGRYMMPAMPIYFLLGLAGFFPSQLRMGRAGWRWVLGTVWSLTLVFVAAGFWFNGVVAYGQDVAVIESEMVTVAHWVSENTAPDDLIAAHDIGALGYFTGRNLIDMAGLVSPEVIPFIRNEEQLAGYLDQRGADWLVTFPGWYPRITATLRPVFSSNGRFAPEQDEENMVIYRWRLP